MSKFEKITSLIKKLCLAAILLVILIGVFSKKPTNNPTGENNTESREGANELPINSSPPSTLNIRETDASVVTPDQIAPVDSLSGSDQAARLVDPEQEAPLTFENKVFMFPFYINGTKLIKSYRHLNLFIENAENLEELPEPFLLQHSLKCKLPPKPDKIVLKTLKLLQATKSMSRSLSTIKKGAFSLSFEFSAKNLEDNIIATQALTALKKDYPDRKNRFLFKIPDSKYNRQLLTRISARSQTPEAFSIIDHEFITYEVQIDPAGESYIKPEELSHIIKFHDSTIDLEINFTIEELKSDANLIRLIKTISKTHESFDLFTLLESAVSEVSLYFIPSVQMRSDEDSLLKIDNYVQTSEQLQQVFRQCTGIFNFMFPSGQNRYLDELALYMNSAKTPEDVVEIARKLTNRLQNTSDSSQRIPEDLGEMLKLLSEPKPLKELLR